MKKIVLIVMAMGLIGCEDYRTSQDRWAKEMAFKGRLENVIDRYERAISRVNSIGGKCFSLGDCMEQEAKMEPQKLTRYTDPAQGHPFGTFEEINPHCQVGDQKFELSEVDTALKTCLVAMKKCGEKCQTK